MLVVGSSLTVWSAYRLAKAAVDGGATLAIVTAGPTRADDLLASGGGLKVEGRAGEVLTRLAAHPSLRAAAAATVSIATEHAGRGAP